MPKIKVIRGGKLVPITEASKPEPIPKAEPEPKPAKRGRPKKVVEPTPLVRPAVCMCGCGQSVRLSKVNDKRNGYVKGQPVHYLRGHANRKRRLDVEDPNPEGICQCGCGQPAPIAKQGNSKLGHVKGKHVKFITGHHNAIDPMLVPARRDLRSAQGRAPLAGGITANGHTEGDGLTRCMCGSRMFESDEDLGIKCAKCGRVLIATDLARIRYSVVNRAN